MKIFTILLMSVGLVCCDPPSQLPVVEKEVITIYLSPSEIREDQAKGSDNNDLSKNKPASTSTISPPLSGKIISIDLSQRLFFANYEDSQFHQKTLDLSGLDLTGEDVMKILHSLNGTTLDRLTRLDLSRNRMVSLPPRVWPLELEYGLRELHLDHNPLYMDDPMNRRATRLELLRLLSLKKLSLSHCGLTNRISLLTLEFPPVESLDLSGNRLVDLPSSLAPLATLRDLDISGNNIRYLSGSPLSSLTGLRTLNLSHNNLQQMWDDPLEKLYNLQTLHLDHNALTEPPKLYHYTGSYQPPMDLYISGNPIRCGCAFKNILSIGRIEVVDRVNITCVDDYSSVRLVDSVPANDCSPRWEAVREKWSGAKRWLRYNRPEWSTLYQSLGWILLGVTLGIVYAHRRLRKTPPPTQVPYNILNDQAGC